MRDGSRDGLRAAVWVSDNARVTDALTLSLVEAEHHLRAFVWEKQADLAEALHGWRDARLTVRVLRGRKMATDQQLFDEVAAALQFPSYFGENWDALEECLCDLEGMRPEAGYVLVVEDPAQVLASEGDSLRLLVGRLRSAAYEWAKPVAAGEWWDRPPVPFHVVLSIRAEDESEVSARWEAAGAHLTRLSP